MKKKKNYIKEILIGFFLIIFFCSFMYLVGYVATGKTAPNWNEAGQIAFVFGCVSSLIAGFSITAELISEK